MLVLMGCPDYIMVPCPACGERNEFQSKGGQEACRTFNLEDAPPDALSDVNRHAPIMCQSCGKPYRVTLQVIATPVLD